MNPNIHALEFRERMESNARQRLRPGIELEKKDGTTHIRARERHGHGQEGAILFYDGTVEDVSGRKRAEMALRENEAFLDSIIEQSPLAMWIADAQGTLRRINPACCRTCCMSPRTK